MVDECGAAGVRSVMVVSSGFAEAGEEGRALQAELRETAAASPAARARAERRGLRELRGPRGAVRHVAAAGAGRRVDQRDLAVGHGGMGDEPARLGPRRRAPDDPRASATRRCSGSATCSRGRPPIRTRRSCARTSRRCATWTASAEDWTRSAPRASRSWSARRRDGARPRGDRSWRTPGRSPGTPRSATRGCAATARSSWRTRSRCSRRRCCCRSGRGCGPSGVAAALQSGGACTLFAEAAGAQGLSLPEFSAATKRKLRKALPHFASQNNPLDVTGQAAVETDMFCGALEALAHDPAVGLVAFDAFPPREEGEDVWAEPGPADRPASCGRRPGSRSRRSR